MKGIIFDLDGTMVNNMMVHHRAWQQKLAEYGLVMEMDEVMKKVHGINEEILERLFGDRYTPEERRRISMEKEEAYRKLFLPDLALIAGLPEFLNRIDEAGIPMGIGSAAPPENIDFVLDNLGIRERFVTVRHARDVSRGKPDPEIYHLVASSMNVSASECLIFEDSPIGAEAAYRAGSQVVVVTTTHSPEEFGHIENVALFIEDFRDSRLGRIY
jgi:HAD superfamily hydrolase (TIGR01509 family)